MLTAAVAELDPRRKAKVLESVRTLDAFDQGCDPDSEADMTFFGLDGESYFFRFDYYSPDMEHGSHDPSEIDKTRRVLTIGFAADY